MVGVTRTDAPFRPANRALWRGVIVAAVAAVLLAAVAAAAGFAAGEHHSRQRVLTGSAYVGEKVATVKVGGWAYGIDQTVPWVDARGTFHDSGWPSCLSPVGATVRVRFAEVPVSGAVGISWRQVVWVDCRR